MDSLLLQVRRLMIAKPSSRRNGPLLFLVVAMSMALGCQLMATRTTTTKTQSRLVDEILKTGGHFNIESGNDPLKIQTVYLPKHSLNEIRPSSLAVFPKLKAVMIIEKQGDYQKELTGFLVDRPDDLLANEYEYQKAGWIK